MSLTPPMSGASPHGYVSDRLKELTGQARELLRDFRESAMVQNMQCMDPVALGGMGHPAVPGEDDARSDVESPNALKATTAQPVAGDAVDEKQGSGESSPESAKGDVAPASVPGILKSPTSGAPASSLRAPAPVYTLSERAYLSFEAQLTSLVNQLEDFAGQPASLSTSAAPIPTSVLPQPQSVDPFSAFGNANGTQSLGGTMTQEDSTFKAGAQQRGRSMSVVRFAEPGDGTTGEDDADGAESTGGYAGPFPSAAQDLEVAGDGDTESVGAVAAAMARSLESPSAGVNRRAPPPLTGDIRGEDPCTVGGLFALPHDNIDNDIARAYSPVGSFRFAGSPSAAGAGSVPTISPSAGRARSGSVMSVFSIDGNDGDASPFSPHAMGGGPGGVRSRALSLDFASGGLPLSPPVTRRLSNGSDSQGSSRRNSLVSGMSPSNVLTAPGADPFVLSPRGRSTPAMADASVTEGMLVQLASRFPALVIRHEAHDASRPTLSLVTNVNATGFSVVDFALHIFESYERETGGAAQAPAPPAAAADPAGSSEMPDGVVQEGSVNISGLPRVASTASVYDGSMNPPNQPIRRKSSLLNKNGHASGASLNGGAGSMHCLRTAIQAADAPTPGLAESFSRTQTPNQLATNSSPPVTPSSTKYAATAQQPAAESAAGSHHKRVPSTGAADSPAVPGPLASTLKADAPPTVFAQAGGMSLVTFTMWQTFIDAAVSVLLQYAFVDVLEFDLAKLVGFLDAVFWLHSSRDGFHGALKAVDALHAAHVVLQQPHVNRYLQDMDLFATLLATLTMDIGHLGVTNDFLVRLGHPITNIFGVSAPLENMSAVLAVTLLRDPRLGFVSDSWLNDKPAVEVFGHRPNGVILKDLLSQLIVATSPGAHLAIVTPLQALFRSAGYNPTGGSSGASPRGSRRRSTGGGGVLHRTTSMESMNGSASAAMSPSAADLATNGEWLSAIREADVPLVLQAIVRLADASYTLREVPVFFQWVDGLVVEYRRQHDEELRQNLSPTLSARIEPNPFEYHYRLMGMVVGPLVDALPIVPHDFRRCIKANIRSSAETTAEEANEILPGITGPTSRWEDHSRMTLSLIKHTSPIATVLLRLGGGGRRASQATPTTSPQEPSVGIAAGTGARAAEALSPNSNRVRSPLVQVREPDLGDLHGTTSSLSEVPTPQPRRGSFSSAAGVLTSFDADIPSSVLLAMLRLMTQHIKQLAAPGGVRSGFEPSFEAEFVRLVYQLAPELLGHGGGANAAGTRPASTASSAISSPAGGSLQPPGAAPAPQRRMSVRAERPRTFAEYASIAREVTRHADAVGWFASPVGAIDGAAGASSAVGYLTSSAAPNVCVAWLLRTWGAIRTAMVSSPVPKGASSGASKTASPVSVSLSAQHAKSSAACSSTGSMHASPATLASTTGPEHALEAPQPPHRTTETRSVEESDEAPAARVEASTAPALVPADEPVPLPPTEGRPAASPARLTALAQPIYNTEASVPSDRTPGKPRLVAPPKYRSPYTLGRR